MDKSANLVDYNIAKTIIHSDFRFTYKAAQEIIDSKKGEFVNELILLNNLSKMLRRKRRECGSINFEGSEVKFVLDKKNSPIDVFFKENLSTNQLIEEFMLLTNKTIAKHLSIGKKNKSSFVYRVHDVPDNDKINSLNNIIKKLGYSIDNKSPKVLSKSLNYLLENVKGKPEQQMVETLTVRAMAKAVYSVNNIGHYGLAFDYYSPLPLLLEDIDLIVHRLIEKSLNKKINNYNKSLEKICNHCSEMERIASQAERDSIKYMQVKFLQHKIGEVYNGVISGVTDWGFYVELCANKCEGLVKISSLKDDHYIYDEKVYALIGYRTNKQYQIGKKVKIKIKKQI